MWLLLTADCRDQALRKYGKRVETPRI